MATPFFGSNSKLWYVEETTIGTTPTSPAFIPVRMNSESLVLQKEPLQSAELDGNRDTSGVRMSANQVTGSISCELSYGSYDDFFEASLQGTWATDALKVGQTERSFTFMRERIDNAGASSFDIFTGVRITNFTFSCSVNSIVTVEFPVLGEGATYSATEPAGATYGAATTSQPMIFVDGSIAIDSTNYALVTGITITQDNAASAQFAIGSNNLAYVGFGRANNTLSIEGAFHDDTIVSDFQSETEVELDVVFALSGDSYTFNFPKSKFTSGAPVVNDDQALTYTAEVQAVRDATDGTSVTLTRATA